MKEKAEQINERKQNRQTVKPRTAQFSKDTETKLQEFIVNTTTKEREILK